MPENGRAVLVVEDDPEINELVGAYVQIAGFEYQPALTGAQAVEKARQTRPALIVLDIMLPHVDGAGSGGIPPARQIRRGCGLSHQAVRSGSVDRGDQGERRGEREFALGR